ncbi:hypothetical protein BDF20DRAFT_574133 [Mycotypha africana]|uniref:uncharacterized protein n=1 Tax=Mycotypha africana TaxID=64632 RepID=UPI002301ADFF|nr:uncharacterized protein BDF20DRAFT_574133 [Mycotypha africana]KAI8977552.1 hypothetical protein BDF20DRAFT_574133 [Mycotypha africana]
MNKLKPVQLSSLRYLRTKINTSLPLSAQYTSKKMPIPYFDADRFVALLQKEGFSHAQAKTVVLALDDVVEESKRNVTNDLVSKHDQEMTIAQYKEDFSKLKQEIQTLERRDVEEVKTANERLKDDIEKLKKTLREEIVRSQAGVRLDLNLDKGRVRDENTEQYNRLQQIDEKIENEVQALKGQMEAYMHFFN